MAALATIGNEIVIALQLGKDLVPFISGIVKDIKSEITGEVITYTIAVQTGQANLDQAAKNFSDVINSVNEELQKQSLPLIDVPEHVMTAFNPVPVQPTQIQGPTPVPTDPVKPSVTSVAQAGQSEVKK